jgi:hypothetical protein
MTDEEKQAARRYLAIIGAKGGKVMSAKKKQAIAANLKRAKEAKRRARAKRGKG